MRARTWIPKFGQVFIYEHCLPFDVTRAVDEASGIRIRASGPPSATGDVARAAGRLIASHRRSAPGGRHPFQPRRRPRTSRQAPQDRRSVFPKSPGGGRVVLSRTSIRNSNTVPAGAFGLDQRRHRASPGGGGRRGPGGPRRRHRPRHARGSGAADRQRRHRVDRLARRVLRQKRTLEVLDRLGCGEEMVAKGVTWNVGRTFFREDEVFSTSAPSPTITGRA